MAVSFGFYNSLNGDRKYDAIQHGSIFDGIIQDGVFMSFGGHFFATPGTGMSINIAEGRAWFNHTWLLNDSILPIPIDQSEIVLKRIDRIVIDVNAIQSVRANSVLYIKGTPSANPVAPTLINETDHHQYPICNILVNAGVTSFTQAEITNFVGTSQCPFVTGIVQGINIDNLISQWGQQWTNFYNAETGEMTATKQQWQAAWNSWYTTETATNSQQWDTWYNNETSTDAAEIQAWQDQRQNDFDVWFASMQGSLGTEPATNLQNQIDLQGRAFAQLLTTGIVRPYDDYPSGQWATYEPFWPTIPPAAMNTLQVSGGDFVYNGLLDNPAPGYSNAKCLLFSYPSVSTPFTMTPAAIGGIRHDRVVISVDKSATASASAIIKVVMGDNVTYPTLSTAANDYHYHLFYLTVDGSGNVTSLSTALSDRLYAESLIGLNSTTVIPMSQGGSGANLSGGPYKSFPYVAAGDTKMSLLLGQNFATELFYPFTNPDPADTYEVAVIRNNGATSNRIPSASLRDILFSSYSPSGAPLSITEGGTGTDNAEQVRINLDVASASHTHSAEDITSDVLPIAHGGIGTSIAFSPSTINFDITDGQGTPVSFATLYKVGKMLHYAYFSYLTMFAKGTIRVDVLNSYSNQEQIQVRPVILYDPYQYTNCYCGGFIDCRTPENLPVWYRLATGASNNHGVQGVPRIINNNIFNFETPIFNTMEDALRLGDVISTIPSGTICRFSMLITVVIRSGPT